MDLRQTINYTNLKKENLKKVFNNINNKLVEIGGTKASNLLDVPNKIKTALSNYKKIAIIQRNENVGVRPSYWLTKTVNLDINFNASLYMIALKFRGTTVPTYISSKIHNSSGNAIQSQYELVFFENIRAKGFDLRIYGYQASDFEIKEIIAIE